MPSSKTCHVCHRQPVTAVPGKSDEYPPFVKDLMRSMQYMNQQVKNITAHSAFQDDSKPEPPDLWGIRFELQKSQADTLQGEDYARRFSEEAQKAQGPLNLACVFKLAGTTLRVLARNQTDANLLYTHRGLVSSALKLNIDPGKPQVQHVEPRNWIALFGAAKAALLNGRNFGVACEDIRISLSRSNGNIKISEVIIKDDHLVVVMPSKQEVNTVLRERYMVLYGQELLAYRWHRKCELDMCFRCYKPGHFQTHCENDARCPYCAGQHEVDQCPVKKRDDQEHSFGKGGSPVTARKKCPNCTDWQEECEFGFEINTNHAAYDKQCEFPDTVAMRSRVARYRRYQMNLPTYLVNSVAELSDAPFVMGDMGQIASASSGSIAKNGNGSNTGKAQKGKATLTSKGRGRSGKGKQNTGNQDSSLTTVRERDDESVFVVSQGEEPENESASSKKPVVPTRPKSPGLSVAAPQPKTTRSSGTNDKPLKTGRGRSTVPAITGTQKRTSSDNSTSQDDELSDSDLDGNAFRELMPGSHDIQKMRTENHRSTGASQRDNSPNHKRGVNPPAVVKAWSDAFKRGAGSAAATDASPTAPTLPQQTASRSPSTDTTSQNNSTRTPEPSSPRLSVSSSPTRQPQPDPSPSQASASQSPAPNSQNSATGIALRPKRHNAGQKKMDENMVETPQTGETPGPKTRGRNNRRGRKTKATD